MPFPVRSIIIALSICVANQAFAKKLTDTTLKRMAVPMRQSNLQSINTIGGIKEGIRAIRADSMEKGIHLVATGIKQAFAVSKIDRVMNYNELEFIELLKILDNGNLSDPEKKLGIELYKMVFQKSTEPTEKNLELYFKEAPNTLFVKRIRLMVHSNEGDSKLPALLNSLLREQPDLLSLNILRAELYLNQNKYQAAIPYFDKSIALSPTYAYAYNLKAKCEGDLEKYDDEIKDEDKALEYFPNYVDAYYRRASAYENLDKYREAATAYLEVNKRHPGYLYTDYSLARCYKAIDILDSALYYINRHIRENADDADGYHLKGNIYYSKEDYPAAVEYFNQAAKIEPDNSGTYENRGNAYFYWGKLDTAITDFTQSAALDKKDPYPVERIGDCYYAMKDYEKSLIYHQKALHIDPKYKFAWVSIGLCYDGMDKPQLAAEACKKAIDIDSTYDNALGNFGWENYRTGHFDECILWSYKALKYNESATYAMFNIALATLRKGEFEKAKELYIHFLNLCKEKDYQMTGGAQTDLRDLIKNNILADKAAAILKEAFHEEP